MLIAALAIAILAFAGFWILGGLLLRAGGLIIAALGVLELAIYANPAGIAPLIIGLLLWLAGHWHYALRHHYYKSPLAQRIFQQLLPERLDPTRGWAWPVQDTVTPPTVRPRRR
jgi:hypothetical protein